MMAEEPVLYTFTDGANAPERERELMIANAAGTDVLEGIAASAARRAPVFA
jgi:hypothetical protein